jgi:hypothetical protein
MFTMIKHAVSSVDSPLQLKALIAVVAMTFLFLIAIRSVKKGSSGRRVAVLSSIAGLLIIPMLVLLPVAAVSKELHEPIIGGGWGQKQKGKIPATSERIVHLTLADVHDIDPDNRSKQVITFDPDIVETEDYSGLWQLKSTNVPISGYVITAKRVRYFQLTIDVRKDVDTPLEPIVFNVPAKAKERVRFTIDLQPYKFAALKTVGCVYFP